MVHGCHVLLSHAEKDSEGQCDCACAVVDYEMPPKTLEFCNGKIYQVKSGLHFIPLESSYVLVFYPSARKNIVLLDSAAYELLNYFQNPCKLDSINSDGLSQQEKQTILEELIAIGFLNPVSK